MSALVDIFAGTVGGIVIVFAGHPFDTTKIRLQTAPPGYYKGTWDCVRQTLRWEGLKGFYAGVWSPLGGNKFWYH
jgi:solute carrier family 25 (mitochondrial carnitine/acylcarnitine transporter), member 20/29